MPKDSESLLAVCLHTYVESLTCSHSDQVKDWSFWLQQAVDWTTSSDSMSITCKLLACKVHAKQAIVRGSVLWWGSMRNMVPLSDGPHGVCIVNYTPCGPILWHFSGPCPQNSGCLVQQAHVRPSHRAPLWELKPTETKVQRNLVLCLCLCTRVLASCVGSFPGVRFPVPCL